MQPETFMPLSGPQPERRGKNLVFLAHFGLGDCKDSTTRWDLASLTMNGRNENTDVIFGTDVNVGNVTFHCK